MPQPSRRSTPRHAAAHPAAVLAPVAFYRAWLGIGLALCLLFPALRAHDQWIGWWPLWLVVMPLVGLALHLPQTHRRDLNRRARR